MADYIIINEGSMGPQGPQGPMGDITPELEQLKSDTLQAKTDTQTALANAQQTINNAATQATQQAGAYATSASTFANNASSAATQATSAASLANLAAQAQSDYNYATCAAMNADLSPADSKKALVYNDKTVAGSRTYTVTTNFSANDTITICGVTFTAVSSGATGNQFNVGADIATSATNLKNVLSTNTTINSLYTIAALNSSITLIETNAGYGNTPTTATTTGTGQISNGTSILSTSNGIWIKQGASGTGSWKKSTYIPPIIAESVGTPEIADEAVTPDKTNSEIPNTRNTYNLFDKAKVVDNYYIQDSDGAPIYNASYGFGYIEIPVTAGSYLFLTTNNEPTDFRPGQMGGFFDSNGNFIQKIATTNYYANTIVGKRTILKVPANATKMKLNVVMSQKDYIIVFQNALNIAYPNKVNSNWLDKNVVRKDDTPFISNILSRLNSLTIMTGGYIGSNGSPGRDSNYNCVCIPVSAGEIYEYSNFYSGNLAVACVFLDSNYNLISVFGGSSPLDITIPSNACYAVFNFSPSLASSVTLKRISVSTEDVLIRKSAIYPAIQDVITNNWDGKLWTAFGDSITYRYLWQPYVIDELGLIHTNCGISSTPVAGSDSQAFWQDVRLNAVKNSNPDIVTILGGANDWSPAYNNQMGTSAEYSKTIGTKDKTTFKGAYSYIIENLLTWKPSLRIIILTTMYGNYESANTTTGLTLTDFANASKEVAEYYGLPCVDLRKEMGLNKVTQSLLTSDGLHPSDAGAKRMAELLIGKLKSINPITGA